MVAPADVHREQGLRIEIAEPEMYIVAAGAGVAVAAVNEADQSPAARQYDARSGADRRATGSRSGRVARSNDDAVLLSRVDRKPQV